MRNFAEKCGKSPKTVERWVKKAKEYNSSRLKTTEKAKTDVLVESAKESFKQAILGRDEILKILSEIASNENRSSFERIRAITCLADIQGYSGGKINISNGQSTTFTVKFGE